MYVNIGNYRTWWIPPSDIIHFACRVLRIPIDDKTSEKQWYTIWEIRLRPYCESLQKWGRYLFPERNTVRIDPWDLYSSNHTLSVIMIPLLKQFKEKTNSFPSIDASDLPDEMQSYTSDVDYDVYYDAHMICDSSDSETFRQNMTAWYYILDEIIWALEQQRDDSNCLQCPRDERKHVLQRMLNGHRLLGKYFHHFWL